MALCGWGSQYQRFSVQYFRTYQQQDPADIKHNGKLKVFIHSYFFVWSFMPHYVHCVFMSVVFLLEFSFAYFEVQFSFLCIFTNKKMTEKVQRNIDNPSKSVISKDLVEISGIKPLTSRMPSGCYVNQ